MRNFTITVMDVVNLGMLEASVHRLSTTKVLCTVFILAPADLVFGSKQAIPALRPSLGWNFSKRRLLIQALLF